MRDAEKRYLTKLGLAQKCDHKWRPYHDPMNLYVECSKCGTVLLGDEAVYWWKDIEAQLTEKDTRIAELEVLLAVFTKHWLEIANHIVDEDVDYDEVMEGVLPRFFDAGRIALEKFGGNPYETAISLRGESNHVANLEAERDRMREALSKCEWVFYPVNESGSSSMCPLCENEIIEGHKSDCEMETILKETLNEFKP